MQIISFLIIHPLKRMRNVLKEIKIRNYLKKKIEALNFFCTANY